jgi:hypothetical protein
MWISYRLLASGSPVEGRQFGRRLGRMAGQGISWWGVVNVVVAKSGLLPTAYLFAKHFLRDPVSDGRFSPRGLYTGLELALGFLQPTGREYVQNE